MGPLGDAEVQPWGSVGQDSGGTGKGPGKGRFNHCHQSISFANNMPATPARTERRRREEATLSGASQVDSVGSRRWRPTEGRARLRPSRSVSVPRRAGALPHPDLGRERPHGPAAFKLPELVGDTRPSTTRAVGDRRRPPRIPTHRSRARAPDAAHGPLGVIKSRPLTQGAYPRCSRWS